MTAPASSTTSSHSCTTTLTSANGRLWLLSLHRWVASTLLVSVPPLFILGKPAPGFSGIEICLSQYLITNIYRRTHTVCLEDYGLIHFRLQALSLLLAMVLRAMVSTSNADYDSDEDFVVIRRPLLVAQGAPSYLPTTADPRAQLWSSSMRQKVRIQLFTLQSY